MKPLAWMLIAGVLAGGAAPLHEVEAAQRGRGDDRRAERGDDRRDRQDARRDRRDDRRDRRNDRRDRYDDRRDRYVGTRDVVIIGDYYRPYVRPLPRGVRHVYARRGYLPPGWAKRMHVVPVHVERRLPPIPRGYRRGIIDGHVVVHNAAGFILDLALLF